MLYYIIIGFLGWYFFYFIFTSEWFDITKVTLKGNNYLSKETVISQGEITFDSNLFHFDVEKANAKLLKNPWIEDVSIKKIFPNKLNIEVIERQPGVLIFYDDCFYLVSEEGIILSIQQEPVNEFNLYIITGLDITKKNPGDSINNREYQSIKRIIYGLENIFPNQFYKIKFISNQEFLLFHKKNQIQVRIENGDQLIDEWYLLEKALQKVMGDEIPLQEINMKFKDRLSIILKQ